MFHRESGVGSGGADTDVSGIGNQEFTCATDLEVDQTLDTSA